MRRDGMWPKGEYEYQVDGRSFDSPCDYIWLEMLGFCGCYSRSLYDLTFKILQHLYEAHQKDEPWYYEYESKNEAETDLQELILHMFDAKRWTEHGTSVRGSWLTEEGARIASIAALPYQLKV
jgi:hypothetical protein